MTGKTRESADFHLFNSKNDGYSIAFPDIEGCYTCGDSIEDGIDMAVDALALTLYDYEQQGKPIPAPSNLRDIPVGDEEFVNYIACDTMAYRKINNNKAVKKTLTIPEWLNEEASAKGVNFSAVLQDALKERLGL